LHLPDETLLYPTHGGGSFCSSGTTGERTSTLGRERETNPLLMHSDEDEFVRWFPGTFPAIPAYFSRMRAANRSGPRLRRDISMPEPLAPQTFAEAAKTGLVVDVRPVEEYARAHIPGSLSNAFRASFATWLGWLAPEGSRLLFVADGIAVNDVVDEALLVGYESFGGYLEGGLAAWERAGFPVASAGIMPPPAAGEAADDGVTLLDVRETGEYAVGHIEGAINVPLGSLQANLDRLPRNRPVVAYCAMGERSTSAASILERAGFKDVRNLAGGIRAWRRAGMPVRT
jgi:rhodanese-related sulfurtransferase